MGAGRGPVARWRIMSRNEQPSTEFRPPESHVLELSQSCLSNAVKCWVIKKYAPCQMVTLTSLDQDPRLVVEDKVYGDTALISDRTFSRCWNESRDSEMSPTCCYVCVTWARKTVFVGILRCTFALEKLLASRQGAYTRYDHMGLVTFNTLHWAFWTVNACKGELKHLLFSYNSLYAARHWWCWASN